MSVRARPTFGSSMYVLKRWRYALIVASAALASSLLFAASRVMFISSICLQSDAPSLRHPIQARVDAFVALVDIQKLRKQLIIDRTMVRLGFVRGAELDAPGNLFDRQMLQRQKRQESGAADVGQNRVLHLANGTIEDVGVDLAPQV